MVTFVIVMIRAVPFRSVPFRFVSSRLVTFRFVPCRAVPFRSVCSVPEREREREPLAWQLGVVLFHNSY